jgi:hypothetical protein
MNVADISEIDPLTFTCEVDMEMILYWKDPRLIGKEQSCVDWGNHWNPCTGLVSRWVCLGLLGFAWGLNTKLQLRMRLVHTSDAKLKPA